MRSRAALGSLTTAGVLVGLLIAIRAADAGSLATPNMSSFQAFGDWVEASGPASVAMSVLRLGTEIALWYLTIVTVIVAIANITRAASLRRVAGVLSAPVPRGLARVLVGMTIATTASPVALSGDQPTRLSPPTTMVALDDASAAAPTMERLGETPSDVAIGRPVPSSGVATGGPVIEDPEPAPTQTENPVAGPATWTVASGESFWVIADETVSDLMGRSASDDEIAPYWRILIEVNRHRLVDPADPDLVLPGQVFELPTPGSSAR